MHHERVFFEIDGVHSAIVRTDQCWASSHLVFAVYAPPDSSSHPAVLFVHGDAAPERLAHMKDHAQFTCWGRIVAASGFVGATFNRCSTEGGRRVAEAEAEVRAMLDGMREHGNAYGIDAMFPQPSRYNRDREGEHAVGRPIAEGAALLRRALADQADD